MFGRGRRVLLLIYTLFFGQIALFFEFDLFLTQPLMTAVNFGGLGYSALCTLSLGLENNTLFIAKSCFRENKIKQLSKIN